MSDVTLEWRHWPLIDEGAKGWLKVGLVVILAGGLWLVLSISLPVLVATVLSLGLVAAVMPYFLPTYYGVSADAIAIRRGWGVTRQRAWQDFSYYTLVPNGFMLIPEESQPALNQFRTLVLPYPPEAVARQLLTEIVYARVIPYKLKGQKAETQMNIDNHR